jgi:5'(3')-deoxyribonucleotidase
MTSDKVIYLDMDGVIADFIEGFINVHRRDDLLEKFYADEWPTTWNFDNEFGPEQDWWKTVDEVGEVFWQYLNAYKWMGRLIMEIEMTGIPWYICTTPRLSKTCLAGKLGWLEHHVGKFDLMMIKDKYRLAHKDALLIDDADTNCNKFHKAGGQTITFPQSWNSNRDLVKDRMPYTLHCLEVFAKGATLANV